MQSINDLIKTSKGAAPKDESAQDKFVKKQKEIKLKEIEREAEEEAAAGGFPFISLTGFPISPEAISLIDQEQATLDGIICFFYDGQNIRLAITDVNNQKVDEISADLKKRYYSTVKVYYISKTSMKNAMKIYDTLPKIEHIDRGVKIEKEDLEKFKKEIADYKNLGNKINDISITDIVTLILAAAMKTNSSDVHIEAEEAGIAVRFRIDGVLQEIAKIEKDKWKKIISRMKLLAKVKINISDKPQDGRFTIFGADEKIEIRASFLPTSFGESVVMRLLRSGAINLEFKDLGLREKSFEVLKREMAKPNGLILTTGPTGSGKTTTLYSILRRLNTPETKIVTMENPIEYQLEGISQSQVDPAKNYTFADGLRSILRQDPDIIMVGEIRDLETAEISIQASLTGHLVLSTLHTNDASGVIPRLVDMGVKPYFLTPSINAVVGQRLLRKLCPKCMVEHLLSEEENEKVEKILAVISPRSGEDVPTTLPTMHKKGAGCEHCNGLGYKGRIGIYEIFTMTENIKKLASEKAPAFQILKQAIEDGMLTMLQDGILKVMTGLTSLEEVYRVIGKIDYIEALYDVVISKTFGRGIKVKETDIIIAKEIAKNPEQAKQKVETLTQKEILSIIMALAIEQDAGDIHIDPTETNVKIRFRIDGILQDVLNLSKEHYLPILSNIKILAGFPTNVKKATWDGRFSIFMPEEKLDCRLSIISGGYGETVVIRILANQAASLDLSLLGMKPYTLDLVKRSMGKTKGVIINTGPTGSGKTTTLYAILNKLNKPDVKIITVEDPIEYHLEGVMQTQINTEEGYTFAAALRSLLRQNPNIMMIGEIRDEETAKIAIESAQTGHLVLSTIHANSAAGAIARFSGLGVDSASLASSIESTIGQRLVRKICPDCKEELKPTEDELREVKNILESINPDVNIEIPTELKFYHGKGCDNCRGIGYKGRVGIYESIEMTPEMQKMIQKEKVTPFEIEEAAVKQGTVTMLQDGVLKALEGDTSIEEIFRVVK